MTTRRTRRKVGLSRIAEPQNVTLTKSPANRTGFKVMRSAEEQQEAQRADGYLVSISLPEEIEDEETAKAVAADYGLDEGYTLKKGSNGRYTLSRDDSEDADVVSISMGDGSVAKVDRAAFQRSEELLQPIAKSEEEEEVERHGVRLTSIRFDRQQFEAPANVDDWLTENSIEYPANGVEQAEDAFIVNVSEADDETREVQFSPGVTAVICRAEETSLPTALYGRTMEQAYGDWGWAQIDFLAAMVDVEFSEQSSRAIRILEDILWKVTFHGEFDLDQRKQLILNALNSYAAFMIGLIDALPRSVIDQTRSDEQPSKQEAEMATKDQKADGSAKTTVERSAQTDEQQTDEQQGAAAQAAETTTAEQDTPVTRSELEGLVAAAVKAALTPASKEGAASAAATEEETAQRSEQEAQETASAGASGEVDLVKAVSDLTEVVRSMADTVKKVPDLNSQIAALRSDFDTEVNGTTIVPPKDEEGTRETARRSDPDNPDAVFDGLLTTRLAG